LVNTALESKHLALQFLYAPARHDSVRFMAKIQPLSRRAFKHLRKITRQAGIRVLEEDVHDMGRRLENICALLSKPDAPLKPDIDLTTQEIAAIRVIKQMVPDSRNRLSARKLSHALGYASSRSGHLLLHRLIDKGVLIQRKGSIEFKRDIEIKAKAAVLQA
jgi:hypothetical protein